MWGVGLNYLHATVRCGLNFDNDKLLLFDAFGYQQKHYLLKKPINIDSETQMAKKFVVKITVSPITETQIKSSSSFMSPWKSN